MLQVILQCWSNPNLDECLTLAVARRICTVPYLWRIYPWSSSRLREMNAKVLVGMKIVSLNRVEYTLQCGMSPKTSRKRLFRVTGDRGEGTDSDSDPAAVAEEEDPNAPTKVLKIPVESMRAGALRVALSFFLLGLQNEPTKGSWRFVQQDDLPLGTVFKDESGMFSINLSGGEKDDTIVVDRHADLGKRPSSAYMLQESVALHKVLDELHSLAFGMGDDGQDIKDEDRLLILSHKDGIVEARKKLPARGA